MQEGNSFFPWYNFQLTNFLNDYLKPNMNVFEFGAGFSTLFYAQKKCMVTSVETKLEWINKITQIGVDNGLSHLFTIKYISPHQIASSILQEDSTFDIIAIDSYHRLECLKSAKNIYKKGLIILDNSERENLQDATNIMSGFQCKIFDGAGINRIGTSQAKVFWQN